MCTKSDSNKVLYKYVHLRIFYVTVVIAKTNESNFSKFELFVPILNQIIRPILGHYIVANKSSQVKYVLVTVTYNFLY